jgi:hypothetical protein
MELNMGCGRFLVGLPIDQAMLKNREQVIKKFGGYYI